METIDEDTIPKIDITLVEDVVEECEFSGAPTPRNSLNLDYDEEEDGLDQTENQDSQEYSQKDSPIEGRLDEDTVYNNISCIQKSNHGSLQNLTLTASGLNLINISILSKYLHLQSVDLSDNQISDLSCLGNLHSLLILNVSRNCIKKLLNFSPPKNLKYANFSHNEIDEIPDLSAYHYLSELYINHNQIRELQGLDKCHRLSKLSVSHNKISKIKNIQLLPLTYLNLSNNLISRIENLEGLTWLREINLANNRIVNLKGLENHHLLESINVNHNGIYSLYEIVHIKDLILLRSFTILHNPIEHIACYQLAILYQIQRLQELNGSPVTINDKVEALNLFDPCLEVVAAKTHIMLTFYSFTKPCHISEITMSNVEDPYPMLVMVGTDGGENKKLAMKLAEKFSDDLGFGILDTTRPILRGEADKKDYNFNTLNHFQQDVLNGQFLVISQYRDFYYGLRYSTIERIAKAGKGCVTHLQLEEMVTLKNSYLRPRFILTIHSTRDRQRAAMEASGHFSHDEIEHALYRYDVAVEYNQDHPGAFFIVINTDNMELAHKRLEELVKSWIGSTEKFPKLYPIGTKPEKKDPTPSRPTSAMAEQSLYTAAKVGVVEEESLNRRYQAAKKVVQAYVPPLYDQIARSTSSASVRNQELSQLIENGEFQVCDSSSDESTITLMTSAPTTAKSSLQCKTPSICESEEEMRKNSHFFDEDAINDSYFVLDYYTIDSSVNDFFDNKNENNNEKNNVYNIEKKNNNDNNNSRIFTSKSATFVMEPTPPSTPRPKTSYSPIKRIGKLGSVKHKIIPPINQSQK